jgi:mannose-1-phosphate guanylyltransferase
MKPAAHPSSPTTNWSLPYGIVLAGGTGERLRAVTEGRQGDHRPKQFCTFTGTRSMLQHTLDRVKTVVPHQNVFTVITSGQERFLPDALTTAPPGRIFTQPADRGTAAAVLLPLTAIYERDPDAAVMIFPCDHFVYPEGRFLEYVVATYRLCRRFRQSLVVLGAAPTSPETDYGWVMTEDPVGNGTSPLLQVGRFIEKPSPEEAKRMLRLGGFWSTMVVAARARTLWDLSWKVLPEVMPQFDTLRGVLHAIRTGLVDREQEQIAIDHVYQRIEAASFSSDVMQRATDSTLLFPMQDVQWSDWGRIKRVAATLRQLGLRSPAPAAQAQAS